MNKRFAALMKVAACAAVLGAFCMGTPSAEAAALQNGQEFNLWPGAAPGSEQVGFSNTITERSKDPAKHDRIITKISTPTLTVYQPEKPNGTSVIVAPGGAYSRIVIDKESGEVADWLNPLGITVFVLHYRLPCEGHIHAKDVPLEDGERAVRIVRQHAAEWGLRTDRIGLLGFSAAGHLAAEVGAQFDKQVYAPVDAADKLSARPDFLILGYPVITMDPAWESTETKNNLLGKSPTKADLRDYSPELHITAHTPPTFLVLADDDPAVPSANAVLYYLGLRKAGVQAEMHIFKEGGHGFGLTRTGDLPLAQWPKLCEQWMTRIGVLEK